MTANVPPAASRRPVWRNAWLLVALVAVGLAGWQWVDHRAQVAELRLEIGQRLDLRQEQENAAGKQVRNDLAAAADRLAAVEARLAAGDEQGRALQALYQDIRRGRDELALFEAEQAINLAVQQLQVAGNVPAARSALQLADERLARSDRPQALALRRAVGKDLERLRALPAADLAGFSLKLETVLQAVDRLPLAMDARPAAAVAAMPEGEPGAWWQAPLRDFWRELRQMVRIQRFDGTEPGLLAPEQAFFLRENLKLRLLNGRLALLSREPEILRGELGQAAVWLGRHFDTRDPGVQAALASLQQVAGAGTAVDLPRLEGTLAALGDLHQGKARE